MYHGLMTMCLNQMVKKALYDSMSVVEFMLGYCGIVLASLPAMEETGVLTDHIDYLGAMMVDTEGGD